MSVGESLPYHSPTTKLLHFFRRSRDQWKAKCKAAKQENKSLKYRLAVMTQNRNRWKAEARELRKYRPEGTEQPLAEPSKNRAQRTAPGRRSRAARSVVVAGG